MYIGKFLTCKSNGESKIRVAIVLNSLSDKTLFKKTAYNYYSTFNWIYSLRKIFFCCLCNTCTTQMCEYFETYHTILICIRTKKFVHRKITLKLIEL